MPTTPRANNVLRTKARDLLGTTAERSKVIAAIGLSVCIETLEYLNVASAIA